MGMPRGKDGASVFDGRSQFDLPGREVTPVDTNGAGDMFAGAFYMDSQMGGDSSGQHPSPFMLQDT